MNLKKLFDKIANKSALQTASFFLGAGGNPSDKSVEKMIKDINGKNGKTVELITEILSGNLKESKLTKSDWKRIEAFFRVLCNCQRSEVMTFVNGKMAKFEGIVNDLKLKLEKHMIEQKGRDDNIFKELRDIKKNAFGNGNNKK